MNSMREPSAETRKFEKTDIFTDMIQEIDSRFGFNGSLQIGDAKNIYDICRYQQAWNISAGSPWCSVWK